MRSPHQFKLKPYQPSWVAEIWSVRFLMSKINGHESVLGSGKFQRVCYLRDITMKCPVSVFSPYHKAFMLSPFAGIAKTGSGKTLAFLLPMYRHVLDQPELDRDDGPIGIQVMISSDTSLVHQLLRKSSLINCFPYYTLVVLISRHWLVWLKELRHNTLRHFFDSLNYGVSVGKPINNGSLRKKNIKGVILKQKGIRMAEDRKDRNALEMTILKSFAIFFFKKYANDDVVPLNLSNM